MIRIEPLRAASGLRLRLIAAVLLLALPVAALAQPIAPASPTAPGANVDELLALARQLSPDLAAMGLDAEGAVARADAAGSLPDPVFRTTFDDIDRREGSLAPSRTRKIVYGVAQEFPLWGKRDLQRDVARFEATSVKERRRVAEVELAARIKMVFADYYAAHEAARLTEEIGRTVGTLADLAQRRYAQGLGPQQDAIRASIEKAEIQTQLARLDAEKRKTAAQLNALLNRPTGAPLALPRVLRPIPAETAINLAELVERARRASPQITVEEAQIAAADSTRRLVEKNWYPDVTLGVGAVDRDRQFAGYEAMIEFKIPLQGDLRRAQEREAVARWGAARSRLDAANARIRGEIEEAYWGLDAARRVYKILHEAHFPQANLSYETALRGFEVNRAELAMVLEAEQRVRRLNLEHLRVLVEQQTRLAELERLVGDDL